MVDQSSSSCRYCDGPLSADARFCSRCGKNVPATEVSAASTSQYHQDRGAMPAVNNYLVWAILTTICCCMPFGVVAIVYAAQVNSALTLGNHEAAVSFSEAARRWCWVAFGVGLVGALIYFPLILFLP